ncbi:hypothetical protein BDC45DRAFT_533841 [Circinella umbellata]|nr:hypothetical protein BDC45DRAFT_533841 [Circinella umbellata]
MAGRNIDHGIDQARTLYKRTMLTKDDCNFYCFTHKMFEIVERHLELFDDQKKKELTENDYVVRLWAPLLFALFNDCRKLKLTYGHVKLLLEGNAMISNLKKYHLKPELALLQGAGNEADILMMKAIDENFTVASRPTKALSISDNLASDKLIFLYNCFLQYKHVTIDLMNLVIAATDESHINSFDKAWISNTSLQESQN